MTTYDAGFVLAFLLWWLFFRRKYDSIAVAMYYFGGVMLADLGCAIVIAPFLRHFPNLIRVAGLVLPIGGVAGLAFGAYKGKLRKAPQPSTSGLDGSKHPQQQKSNTDESQPSRLA
jgi:hypothetical protein